MRKDKFTKAQRSRLMSRIHSKETGFENKIFTELKKRGLRFRKHYSKIIGKPDIALPKMRKAIFLHSDFWHGWYFPKWEHILPSSFWKQKIRKNRRRDRKVLTTLRIQGWEVMVVWQHQIRKKPDASISKIIRFLKQP